MENPIEFYINNHDYDCENKRNAPKHPFIPEFTCNYRRYVVMFNYRYIILTFNSCWHGYRKPHETIKGILNNTLGTMKTKPKHSLLFQSWDINNEVKKAIDENYLQDSVCNVHYLYSSAVKEYALVSYSNYFERFVNESDILLESYKEFIEYVEKTFASNEYEKNNLLQQLKELAYYNPIVNVNPKLVSNKVDEIIKQLKLEINGNH